VSDVERVEIIGRSSADPLRARVWVARIRIATAYRFDAPR